MDGQGRARGRGRDTGSQQPQSGRRPGGNGGGGRPGGNGGGGRPGGNVPAQRQGAQPPQPQPSTGRGTSGRGGGGAQPPQTSGAAAGGPRYGAPTAPMAGEGRAALHRVADTVAGGDSGSQRSDGSKEAQRGAIRGRRVISEILRTKPADMQSKKGESGKQVSLQTNYFRILKKPTWSLYQYRVDFKPEQAISGLRNRLIFEQKATLGGYLFDGTMLFVTQKLRNETVEFMSKDRDGNIIQIVLKYVGECEMTSASSLQVLNLILRRAMGGLKLQLVGRNFFDAVAKVDIKDFKIQLWPGYLTSIRQHEVDILLCAEITNKVMRIETVWDIMQKYRQEERDYIRAIEANVTGMTVLTDYTNKTYRIDSIDFDKSPQSTFDTRDGPVSFAEYYKKKYNIIIRDMNQPLLISKAKARDIRGGGSEYIALVPELCRATGLTEQMKSNFQLAKAMSDYTRMAPDKRISKLMKFNQRLNQTPDSMSVLKEWNLGLEGRLVEIPGRVLPPETIVFSQGKQALTGPDADWTRDIVKNSLFATASLQRWCVIFPPRVAREANDFLKLMNDVARGFNMQMNRPETIQMNDDRQNSYNQAIDRAVNNDIQLLMIVVPNNSSDRYSNIKKKCCVDRPVPTQVLVARTITPKGGNPRGLMSVATKVVIQINCKLGGAPWMIKMPIGGLMTIGFDVCHDTRDKSKSYGAMVATMDLKKQVNYFSAVSAHTNGEELSNELTLNVTKALKEYRQFNNALPEKILFYRDGVGEGQTNYVFEHEVKRIQAKLDEVYTSAGAPPCKMTFIIVSKRINTRIFQNERNPPPGTVVDDIITLPERYDFFLVSQSVRQGTVSPTSYNVLWDFMGLSPDKIQILTYKQTHLYYNWSGTTRVPAVCQYAHKLAFLVGQYIHQSPSAVMEKHLYFL